MDPWSWKCQFYNVFIGRHQEIALAKADDLIPLGGWRHLGWRLFVRDVWKLT